MFTLSFRTGIRGQVSGSGRQGCNLAGASPAVSIARFRHVAIPQQQRVTIAALRGVKGPAARKASNFRGGGNRGTEQTGEPEHQRMTAASSRPPLWKLLCRDCLACRTSRNLREAEVFREATGQCTERTRRGKGPGASVQIAEITSGRSSSQQGLTTTCKDRPHKAYKLRWQEERGSAHESALARTAG